MKARYNISSIYTEQGAKLTEPIQIQQDFIQFFQNLLGTSVTTMPYMDLEIPREGPCITVLQQQDLLLPVTILDVEKAINDLPVDKSPGIDRFNAKNFKAYLPIIGEKVTAGVL